MYDPPRRFKLSTYVLDGEAARVHLEQMEAISERKGLTMLCNGWEDTARRSLYASIAAEVGQHPVILGLVDMTGQRATQDHPATQARTHQSEPSLSQSGW